MIRIQVEMTCIVEKLVTTVCKLFHMSLQEKKLVLKLDFLLHLNLQ